MLIKAKCHECGKIGHVKKVCGSSYPQDTIRTVEDAPTTMKEKYEIYYLENVTLPRTLTKST